MQVVQTPVALPGCCFICRGSIRESYIDTGISIDYEGVFYICNECVNEMAHLHGYLSVDEYKDLRIQKEDSERQVFVLIKRLGELEEIDRALVAAGYKRNDAGDIVRVGGYSTESDEIAIQGVHQSAESVGIGEGEITESSDDDDLARVQPSEQSSSHEPDFDFKL